MTSKSPREPTEIKLGKVNPSRSKTSIDWFKSRDDGDTSWLYKEPSSDEAILHSINPITVEMKERCINKITTIYDESIRPEDIPARRTFVSHE